NLVLLLLRFFSSGTAITDIYTLSLHDALPIYDWNTFENLMPLKAPEESDATDHVKRTTARRAKEFVKVSRLREYPVYNFGQFRLDRKSTRLNSSHDQISYAVFCLKKKNNHILR